MAKTFWYNQEVLFRTTLPRGDWAKGKEYYFLKDGDGTIYATRIDGNGNPDLS